MCLFVCVHICVCMCACLCVCSFVINQFDQSKPPGIGNKIKEHAACKERAYLKEKDKGSRLLLFCTKEEYQEDTSERNSRSGVKNTTLRRY